jgi:hypothetical protein
LMMVRLVVLAVVLALVGPAFAGDCLVMKDNPKATLTSVDAEPGPPCEHYNGGTCCNDPSVILNATTSENCVARSQNCLEQLGMLACLSCHDDAKSFQKDDATAFPVKVCKELGDRIMFACKVRLRFVVVGRWVFWGERTGRACVGGIF